MYYIGIDISKFKHDCAVISMQKITGRITAMPPPVRFPTAFYFRC